MTDTRVPAGTKITWSHSALETYRLCPLKYWAERVSKLAKDEPGAATVWGKDVHTALEHAGRDGVPLPGNMVQYQPVLDKVLKLKSVASETLFEDQMAIRRDGTPCLWFDAGAWGRAIADVNVFLNENRLLCLDWKTGKYRGKSWQAVTLAKLAFHNYPKIDRITTSFAYVAAKVTDNAEFLRENIDKDFKPVADDIARLEDSFANHNFPPKPNFLCRNWCGYFECAHNGRSRA
jgi:hypothetical protein